MKRLKSYWYENSFFVHFLDKKTIQNDIFSLGDTWFHENTSIVMSYSNFKSNAENAQ